MSTGKFLSVCIGKKNGKHSSREHHEERSRTVKSYSKIRLLETFCTVKKSLGKGIGYYEAYFEDA